MRRDRAIMGAASSTAGNAATKLSDAEKLQQINDMAVNYHKKYEAVEEVTAHELQRWLASSSGSASSDDTTASSSTQSPQAGHASNPAPGKPIILVDCRTPGERAVSRLPGSIPQEAFEARLKGQGSSASSKGGDSSEATGAAASLEGATVVAYCTIGYRSGLFANGLAKDHGLKAYNLRGSILSWAHAGGALVDATGKPTKRLHTYGAKWALEPAGYESTWYGKNKCC